MLDDKKEFFYRIRFLRYYLLFYQICIRYFCVMRLKEFRAINTKHLIRKDSTFEAEIDLTYIPKANVTVKNFCSKHSRFASRRVF